jgi:hypothetical protein
MGLGVFRVGGRVMSIFNNANYISSLSDGYHLYADLASLQQIGIKRATDKKLHKR